MIDLQQALVADHIASLEREGSAIRAERELDHVRAHDVAGTDADHPADLPSRRIRLGHWLVAVGEAIAGSTRPNPMAGRTLAATAAAAQDDPCDDDFERLARAA